MFHLFVNFDFRHELEFCSGYNASILAYGCTGTGKTYTINGGYDEDIFDEEMSKGIVPWAIEDVFL